MLSSDRMLSNIIKKATEALLTLPKAETDYFLASKSLPYPVQKSLEKYLEEGKTAVDKAAGYSIVGQRAVALISDRDLYSCTSILDSLSFTGIRGGFVVVVLEMFNDIRFLAEKIGLPCVDYNPRKPLVKYVNIVLDYSEAVELPFILRAPLFSLAETPTAESVLKRIRPRPYFNKHWLRPYRWNILASRVLEKSVADHERNIKVLEKLSTELEINEIDEKGTKKTAVVSASCSQEAPENNTVITLGFMNPFPKKILEKYLAQAEEVTVVDSGKLYIKEKIGLTEAKVKKIEQKYEKICGGCPFPYILYAVHKALSEEDEVGVICIDMNCYTLVFSTQKPFPENYQIKSTSYFQRDFRDTADIVLSENSSINIAKAIAETGYQDGPVIAITDLHKAKNAGDLPANLYIIAVNTLSEEHSLRKLPLNLDDLVEQLNKIFKTEDSCIAVFDKPCSLASKNSCNSIKIDEELCDKCGECLKLLCEALTLEGDRIVVKKEYCRNCGYCTEICSRSALKP